MLHSLSMVQKQKRLQHKSGWDSPRPRPRLQPFRNDVPAPTPVPAPSVLISEADSCAFQRPMPPMVKCIGNVSDLNRIRISRTTCEQFVHYPCFDSMITGAFVRLQIGQIPKTVYLVAEVIRVEEKSKVYTLGSTRTNKILKFRDGGNEKDCRMEFISNDEFTEQEYKRWLTMCKTQSIALPTIEFVSWKFLEIQNIGNYQLKDSDITKMVKDKERFKLVPGNNAKKKVSLLHEKQVALRQGDRSRVKEIDDEVRRLERNTSGMNVASTFPASNVAMINARNRKKNLEKMDRISEGSREKDEIEVNFFNRRSAKPARLSVPSKIIPLYKRVPQKQVEVVTLD